ncbi:phage tail protein [Vibrio alginolyticus]|uniref:phage tail-collar fiber domain-containing protein n=1 Tax=Vibrio alginolyticus TaxID=663 RepID=UPI0018E2E6D8|nr:phage tail protein [Vibrio alginolyticus]
MANTTDKSILTAAGKALLAQLNAEEKPLIIDKMIFANVPNRPEFPQPDDVVPTDHVVHQEGVEQRGRLSADSVIYSTTLTSDVGPFEFNWTGAYCSEYGVLVTIDHHALTPKSADEPGVAGNTLVRSVVLEYKDIAEITNITVDASSWQYNATPRMKKMDDDVAQAIIDQNGKDWFIEDGFLVTPQASAFNIKAGAGYVSGNRVVLEFDRNVQVLNKPSFIYVDAHREGTPTGEQVTLFDFVITAEEKDDYTDANGVKHFVCKITQVLADGSVSDLRPEGEAAAKSMVRDLAGEEWVAGKVVVDPNREYVFKSSERLSIRVHAPNANIFNPIKMGESPILDDEFVPVATGANVEDYGVLPNTGEDTTDLIKKVINKTKNIIFGSGVFLVSSLTLASDLTIHMKPDTILKQIDDGNVINMFSGASLSNVNIFGGQIEINSDAQSSYNDGQEPNKGRVLFLNNSTNINIKGLKLPSIFGSGLYLTNSSKISINDIEARDNYGRFLGYPVYLVRCSDATVNDSRFYGTRDFGGKSSSFGVYAKDSALNVTVDKCHFEKYQCLIDGSESSPTPVNMGSGAKITNNTIIEPIADTTIRFCKHGLIQGNIVRRSGDFGLSVGDSESIQVLGNIVEDSNTVGIGIRKSQNCSVIGNTLINPCTNFKGVDLIESQRAGIYVLGDSRRCSISGNTIIDVRSVSSEKMTHAIRIEDYANGNKGEDTSSGIIGTNVCYGSKSGLDIYADGLDNFLMSTNYRNDQRFTSVHVGAEPVSNPKEGNIRANVVTKKLKYFDGETDRDLPRIVDTPANSSSPGKKGDVAFNSSYLFICNNDNSWRRVALETF